MTAPSSKPDSAIARISNVRSASTNVNSSKTSTNSTMSPSKISHNYGISQQPSTPYYFKLPLEIFTMIALLCDAKDLPNLRLVCKHFLSFATKSFGDVCLSDLRHHLTKPSLEDLVSITAHHIFASCVKSIKFSTARETGINRWRIFDDLEEGDFRQSGQHVDMLVEALGNLKRCGNLKVFLGSFDKVTNVVHTILNKGHGYDKSYGVSETEAMDAHGTFSAISKATRLSEFPFKYISAHMSSTETFRHLRDVDKTEIIFSDGSFRLKPDLSVKLVFYQSFSIHEESLALTIQTGTTSEIRVEGSRWTVYRRQPYPVSKVLHYLAAIGGIFHYNRFKCLTLNNMTFEAESSGRLLALTRQSYQHLKISHVTLWDSNFDPEPDLGIRFLTHYKKCLGIETLEISNLWLIVGLPRHNKGHRFAKQKIVARGKVEVQRVLAGLLDMVEGWYNKVREKTSNDENVSRQTHESESESEDEEDADYEENGYWLSSRDKIFRFR
ncbi:hypothetical protein D6C82_09265 [Aureobasidium pullulans]|nr:hypothetical protein D6C82_09265 [Aureobasidium pullulans]